MFNKCVTAKIYKARKETIITFILAAWSTDAQLIHTFIKKRAQMLMSLSPAVPRCQELTLCGTNKSCMCVFIHTSRFSNTLRTAAYSTDVFTDEHFFTILHVAV